MHEHETETRGRVSCGACLAAHRKGAFFSAGCADLSWTSLTDRNSGSGLVVEDRPSWWSVVLIVGVELGPPWQLTLKTSKKILSLFNGLLSRSLLIISSTVRATCPASTHLNLNGSAIWMEEATRRRRCGFREPAGSMSKQQGSDARGMHTRASIPWCRQSNPDQTVAVPAAPGDLEICKVHKGKGTTDSSRT